jgi:cytochrome c biogenesis protein CcdA
MIELVAAFLAGVLTVFAPCVLPLLPVIIGGSVVRGQDSTRSESARRRSGFVIIGSLVASIVIFTLLLKATTTLLGVPQQVWTTLSGLLVVGVGVSFALPGVWDRIAARLSRQSGESLRSSRAKGGAWGDVLLGAALGPAFNSCSPTYALIVASILPASFVQGLAYLVAYAVGLGATLLLLSFAGEALIRRLGWLADPHGKFRRVIGILLILVGLTVMFGVDRQVQSYVLEQGWYDPISEFEQRLGI